MSARRLHEEQPASFAYTPENLDWARQQVAKFPPGRQASAVVPLLWRAQEQEGWVTEPAIRYVADMLEMPYIRALEVATFYTMFNLEPVGRIHVQVCGTTPCVLRGAEDIKRVCERRIGPKGYRTPDGTLSWAEVECLGACVNAPMVQIEKDYYEDLTPETFERLLDDLVVGRAVRPGPQNGRQFSAPDGGPTTLRDPSLYAAKPHEDEGRIDTPAPVAAGRPHLDQRANQAAADTPADRATRGEVPIPREDVRRQDALAEVAPRGPQGEVGPRPVLLEEPRGGKPDDLTRLVGVGPKIEAILHRMGIFHFDQIAAWSEENLRWVDENLGAFRGRAQRDRWVEQARTIAEGRSAAEAERVAASGRGEG